MAKRLPKEFLDRLKSITAKRARTVIDHILKHGHVTTDELQDVHGYEHPPRAARDVREQGIPLETFRVTNKQGRKIAAYRFADPSKIRQDVLAGRKVISKEFKQELVSRDGSRCGVCMTPMEARYLQVDHRVSYQVAGEGRGKRRLQDFMLICGSCNRAKSWSCEHCPNWLEHRKPATCNSCYWANPDRYTHIAMQDLRRLDMTWGHSEVGDYDQLAKRAKDAEKPIGDYVKGLIQAVVKAKRPPA